MDTLCQDTGPGGHIELQEALRGIKVDLDCQDIVEGAEYNGIGCGHNGSGSDVEMNMPGYQNRQMAMSNSAQTV